MATGRSAEARGQSRNHGPVELSRILLGVECLLVAHEQTLTTLLGLCGTDHGGLLATVGLALIVFEFRNESAFAIKSQEGMQLALRPSLNSKRRHTHA
jgi:hypothetical protein